MAVQAFRALMELPVGDVVPLPEDLYVAELATEVLCELPSILSKCFHCVRLGLAVALDAFVQLLLHAATHGVDQLARVLLTTASSEGRRCADLFEVLCIDLLSSSQISFRRQLEMESVLELIQLLSNCQALKEPWGAKLMPALLSFLYFPDNHELDYRQPRGVACALINLLRGSKSNKNRMGAECGAIAEVLATTSDFFFQMQCVEILFRLHVHNRTVVQQSHMPDDLKRGVTSLSNDTTLLVSIQSLLDAFNAEHNQQKIIALTTLRVEAGHASEVCGPTKAYFSPSFLVIMLPGGTGDNITIPFEHIRSVKLSKDQKLGLRLARIPAKLSLVMSATSDGDNDLLSLCMTASTILVLRASRVHEWIAQRKRLAPLQPQQPPSRGANPASAGAEDGEASGLARSAVHDDSHASVPKRSREQREGLGCGSERRMEVPQPPSEWEGDRADGERGDSLRSVQRQLEDMATRRADQFREGEASAFGSVMETFTVKLEEAQRESARERNAFEASVREEVRALREAEEEMKRYAAECVETLNRELQEVQALGSVVQEEIDAVVTAIQQSAGAAAAEEERRLAAFKDAIDRKMVAAEATLTAFFTATNPLQMLSSYVQGTMATSP